jgi:hypothetical protein
MKHHQPAGYLGKVLVIFISVTIAFSFLVLVRNSEAGVADKLMNDLRSRNPAVREEAAQKLGDLKDPIAVDPLIVILRKDKDRNVRWRAEDALVNIGAPAVEPLIKMLNDDSWRARRRAVRTLGKIRDPRAIDALVVSMKRDEDCYVRKSAAGAIGEIKDPRAGEVLIPALKSRNLEVVEGAYRFFIRRGESGSEAVLIESLNKNWNKTMVVDFLKSGNRQLEEAAADCAKKRGYPVPSTVDWVVPKWGQAL